CTTAWATETNLDMSILRAIQISSGRKMFMPYGTEPKPENGIPQRLLGKDLYGENWMDRCGAHWWTAFENTVNAQVVKNRHYTHNAAQKAKEKAHTCAIAWLRQLSLGQGIMNVESNAMK